jgi:hypothetical protein
MVEIRDIHGGEYSDFGLPGCDTVGGYRFLPQNYHLNLHDK